MSEFVEYNRDTNPYPSSGKKYNNEKAIISLTSWKARINTVSKTLFSLIKQCPGFHIVLVLSEEEFPQKEKELPENLMVFVENELIELLWVWKNYKSFKKVLFTMDKYRDVPVISADDDCIYTCNYAQELYDNLSTSPVSYRYFMQDNIKKECRGRVGCAVIFPSYFFGKLGLENLSTPILERNQDDPYYEWLAYKFKLPTVKLLNKLCPCKFENEFNPLRNVYGRNGFDKKTVEIYKKELNIK